VFNIIFAENVNYLTVLIKFLNILNFFIIIALFKYA